MSIVIQGIDIPKRHYVEGYYIDEDGNVLDISRKRIIGKATKLPPHGRLIDADRLLTDRMKSKYYHLPNGDTAIPIIDIEHAPTVLEAEKTE